MPNFNLMDLIDIYSISKMPELYAQVNDPASGGMTPPIVPTVPAPTPPIAAPERDPDKTDYLAERLRKKGEDDVASHLEDLRRDQIKFRRERNAERERATAAEAEVARLKGIQAEAENKRLESERQFEELWKKEQIAKQEVILTRNAAVVEARLEAAFERQGYNPKLMKLVDLTGVAVDVSGKITGLDNAIERFINENSDLLTPVKQAPAAGQPQTPASPQSGRLELPDGHYVQGSMVPYKDLKKTMNLGAGTPNVRPAAEITQADSGKDVRELSKADYAKAKKAQLSQLSKR